MEKNKKSAKKVKKRLENHEQKYIMNNHIYNEPKECIK